MPSSSQDPFIAALEWHIAAGADEAVGDVPFDRTKAAVPPLAAAKTHIDRPVSLPPAAIESGGELLGTAQMRDQAAKIAASCATLGELSAAIAAFDGLSIKRTAANMVFADGNPESRVMVIGEAPAADEDRSGVPFVGEIGRLFDRIFASIGLSRGGDTPDNSLYITNVINWRPPGNRTPSPSEIEISLPFIERHIALAKPDILVLCGGLAAKSLLQSGDAISKLRGKIRTYMPVNKSDGAVDVPVLVTYHPSYLLRTPAQKRLVWHDMLMLKDWLTETAR